MLHPALDRALVTAHIEDLHRAAARRRAILFARRVAHEPHSGGHTNRDAAIRVDSAAWTPCASGRRHDTNRDSSSGRHPFSVT